MQRATGSVILSLSLLSAGLPLLHGQESRPPLELRRVSSWADGRLRESSGVAVSRRHAGLLWTHNDSGDGPTLYLADTTGGLRAIFEVAGARNVDWEALALGSCAPAQWRGRTCLYIADTGDNEERRTRVVIYAVPEPESLPPGGPAQGLTQPARALRLRYADRPRDAEALAVLGAGRLALVTKGRTGPILRYNIPAEAWQRDDFTLAAADTLPIVPQMALGRWVTDAASAPDGRHVVVRTYTEVYRFRVGEPRWIQAGPACGIGLVEPQGEGVDFLDDDRMILTSERARRMEGGITLLRCDWN
jgi:hypothetical protein